MKRPSVLLLKKEKTAFILGDFNIDLLKYHDNNLVNTFVNLMYSYSFFPCIDRPTRIYTTKRGTTISLIDNIFTNDTDHKIKSGNLITDISDHFPNFVSVKSHRYQMYPNLLTKISDSSNLIILKDLKTTSLMLIGIL